MFDELNPCHQSMILVGDAQGNSLMTQVINFAALACLDLNQNIVLDMSECCNWIVIASVKKLALMAILSLIHSTTLCVVLSS